MANGKTRKQARQTARAHGPGHKVKTASRLTEAQKGRKVSYHAKTKKGGGVKTTAGGTRVPYFAIVAPKKTRKKKSTPSL